MSLAKPNSLVSKVESLFGIGCPVWLRHKGETLKGQSNVGKCHMGKLRVSSVDDRTNEGS